MIICNVNCALFITWWTCGEPMTYRTIASTDEKIRDGRRRNYVYGSKTIMVAVGGTS